MKMRAFSTDDTQLWAGVETKNPQVSANDVLIQHESDMRWREANLIRDGARLEFNAVWQHGNGEVEISAWAAIFAHEDIAITLANGFDTAIHEGMLLNMGFERII